MSEPSRRIAVVTGASSGIGAATAERLAAEGFEVVLGARRMEELQAVARRAGGRALPLDVTDQTSVDAFSEEVPDASVLVNNAGLARGLEAVAELPEENIRTMWETNVMGLVRVTQAFVAKLEASGDGHIVNVGSIAGFETYPGGGGYTASKHAVRALTRTLRIELLGKPIRVTEIAPGLVETGFSKVRFDGDPELSGAPYRGIEPLTGHDIADCVAWAVTRPPHVNVDEIVVRPRAQATARDVFRSG